MLKTLVYFLLLRLCSVFLIQTAFVPDEYWQCLEVSHHFSFGYGYRTWEFSTGIRNQIYPFIFSVIYYVLRLLNLDSLWAVIYVPRIFQALLSGGTDYVFYNLCLRNKLGSSWIKIAVGTDWFLFFCSSRTLINTFEYNLVVLSLWNFPTNFRESKNISTFAFFVCSSIFIRPTSGIVWAPFCFYWMLATPFKFWPTIIVQFAKLLTFLFVVFTTFDSWLYGQFTITPWNFLKFNLKHGIASFYGTHPFYWYITQGIYVVFGLMVFPFLLSAIVILRNIFSEKKTIKPIDRLNAIFLPTIATTTLIYSLISHKEFRFIMPLSPMVTFIGLQSLSAIKSERLEKLIKVLFVGLFAVSTVFFGLVHQRGTLDAMKVLAAEAESRPDTTNILFLMPCHSTPLYSHLHVPVKTRFITCEPPIYPNSIDESEIFFADPLLWLNRHWSEENSFPTHVVMFDVLENQVKSFLEERNFKKVSVIFHTPLPSGRVGGNVLIYRSNEWNL